MTFFYLFWFRILKNPKKLYLPGSSVLWLRIAILSKPIVKLIFKRNKKNRKNLHIDHTVCTSFYVFAFHLFLCYWGNGLPDDHYWLFNVMIAENFSVLIKVHNCPDYECMKFCALSDWKLTILTSATQSLWIHKRQYLGHSEQFWQQKIYLLKKTLLSYFIVTVWEEEVSKKILVCLIHL